MKLTFRSSLLVVSSVVIAACGDGGNSNSGGASGGSGGAGSSSSGGQGGSVAATGLPCDVNDILVQSCQKCHSDPPVFGAPMPLITHADLHAAAKSDPSRSVYELVGERIHDTLLPMPQPPNAALDDPSLKTMDAWIAAGAPSSSESCGGAGGSGSGGGSPVSCVPDVHIAPSQPYVMDKNVEDLYACYGFDVTPAQKSQITAIVPRIDNSTIVHHMLLFQADASSSSVPTQCSGGAFAGRLLAVWAPGGQPMELPPEVGLPIEGTTHYTIQIHYSNLMHLDGQKDTTGYDLCTTTSLRPNEGDVLAFGTTKFTIPAAGKLDITCDFDIPVGLPGRTAISGMPHMHKLGKTISTMNLPAGGGAPVDLGTRAAWNFDAQYWTDLNTVVKGGDKVRTRCVWENPGASPVSYGEQTNDEMCYSFVFYYPRITTPGWNWSLPAVGSKCSPTP